MSSARSTGNHNVRSLPAGDEASVGRQGGCAGSSDAYSSDAAARLILEPSLDRHRSSIRTMRDAVFLDLRDAILSGEIKPGAPLRLQHLAVRMQVSMQPIREAIRRLENIGLVEVEPNRGARVRQMSVEDLLDTYTVRLQLETFAVMRAAERFTERDAVRARAHLLDQQRLERAREVESARAAHTAFHFTIYEAAGSPWLVRSIQPLWENSERYRMASLAIRGSVARRKAEHEGILNACIRHDPEAAAAELDRHLRLTANLTARKMGSSNIL